MQSSSFFRRTGKDIKAGKVIRKMPGGFENFDDYWSESGQQSTLLLFKFFYNMYRVFHLTSNHFLLSSWEILPSSSVPKSCQGVKDQYIFQGKFLSC